MKRYRRRTVQQRRRERAIRSVRNRERDINLKIKAVNKRVAREWKSIKQRERVMDKVYSEYVEPALEREIKDTEKISELEHQVSELKSNSTLVLEKERLETQLAMANNEIEQLNACIAELTTTAPASVAAWRARIDVQNGRVRDLTRRLAALTDEKKRVDAAIDTMQETIRMRSCIFGDAQVKPCLADNPEIRLTHFQRFISRLFRFPRGGNTA